jgi:transposase
MLKVWKSCVLQGVSGLCIANDIFANKYISGIKLVYLPPYSPDLNPIEECFAFIKSYIRCRGQEFRDSVESGNKAGPYLYLYAALDKVTPIASRGWFRNSGYL